MFSRFLHRCSNPAFKGKLMIASVLGGGVTLSAVTLLRRYNVTNVSPPSSISSSMNTVPITSQLLNVGVDDEDEMLISLEGIRSAKQINIKYHYEVTASQEKEIKKQLKFRDIDKSGTKYPINGCIYKTDKEYENDSIYYGGKQVFEAIIDSKPSQKYKIAVCIYNGIMRNEKLSAKYRGKWVYVEPVYDNNIVSDINVYIFASEQEFYDNISQLESMENEGYWNCMGLEYLPYRNYYNISFDQNPVNMTVQQYPSGIRDVDCFVDDSGFGLVDTILGYHDWASRAKAEFEKIRTLNSWTNTERC